MGKVSVNVGSDGSRVTAAYDDVKSDGIIDDKEKERALAALKRQFEIISSKGFKTDFGDYGEQRKISDLTPLFSHIEISESKDTYWGLSSEVTREVFDGDSISPGWNSSMLKLFAPDKKKSSKAGHAILEGGPLTVEELKKIPKDSVAGRFLHFVGEADSVLDLYSKIVASKEDTGMVGVIRERKVKEWEGKIKDDADFKIGIPELSEELSRGLEGVLKRNIRTGKKPGDTQLAHEFFDGDPAIKDDEGVRELIQLANNPESNVATQEAGQIDPGADKDQQTLNVNEIKTLAKYLDWKPEEVLELIAAYKTVIAYYRQANEKEG